jgi:sugar phosphate permease
VASYRWVVLSVGTLAAAGYAAVPLGLAAIAPELASEFDLSVQQVGLLFGISSLGQVVLLLPWGFAADRFGERAVIGVGLALTAAALAAATRTNTFGGLLLVLTAAAGFGASAATGSGRAVMQWFARSQRGLALGVRQTAIPLGGALGALALPPITIAGGVDAAFLALAGLCAFCALAGTAFLREGPAHADEELHEVGRPLRDRRIWILCIGSAFVLVAQIAIMNFVVLFLHDARGVGTARAAGVLAAVQVVGGFLRVAGGKLTDRDGKRVPLFRALAFALAVAMAATAALVDAPLSVLVPVLIVAGGLGMSWNGLSFTAAAEIAGRRRAGAAVGFQQTALAVGSAAAPIAFAAVAASSWRAAFALSALCPLVGAAVLRPLRGL